MIKLPFSSGLLRARFSLDLIKPRRPTLPAGLFLFLFRPRIAGEQSGGRPVRAICLLVAALVAFSALVDAAIAAEPVDLLLVLAPMSRAVSTMPNSSSSATAMLRP